MARVLKIYDGDPKVLAATAGVTVIERYPAFVVAEVEEAVASEIVGARLTEDITDSYPIDHGADGIDTSVARIDSAGATKTHPSYRRAPALPAGPHHYLVQFIGPIRKPWLAAVKKAGGEVVAPWSGFTMVVRMTAKAVRAVAALRVVRWMGHLPYDARISPNVSGAKSGEKADPLTPRTRYLPGAYTVEFFRADLAVAAKPKVKRLGFEIVEFAEKSAVMIVRAKAAKDGADSRLEVRLRDLSHVHGVRRIAAQPIRRTSNDRAAVIMGTAKALAATGAASGLGLSGAGEIIAVCDTGLDNGDPATIHPDFKGRLAAIKSYPIGPMYAPYVKNPGGDDGARDLNSGHGTHTSGSVLGDGAASSNLPGLAGPVRGLAYKAKLVFQAVEQEVKWKDPDDETARGRFALAGLPSDLTTLFTWAYGQGARIHSNSWGGGDPGAYDDQCEQVDRFIWTHPDFCILFSAGNDGTDRDANGVVDPGSITAPGTAKNCITVGASENNRPDFTTTYGASWPSDYPTAPISTDRLADNPNQVVAFSSRGPTRDGRIKPDVVAPGTYILSTRSRLLAANQYGYGRYQSSSLYMFDSGTSMATPLTAGGVGVLREYLRKKAGFPNPTAALLKAALIAGATGLNPAAARPNNDEGFGRVNLDAVVAPAAPITALFFEGAGLKTGAQVEKVITVAAPAGPLKVVMVYSDYPGPRLVNNLNLIVTGPDGVPHVGNAAPGSNVFDGQNNVEVVTLPAAAAGDWHLRMVGSNIPNGPQPYALVVLGVARWKT